MGYSYIVPYLNFRTFAFHTYIIQLLLYLWTLHFSHTFKWQSLYSYSFLVSPDAGNLSSASSLVAALSATFPVCTRVLHHPAPDCPSGFASFIGYFKRFMNLLNYVIVKLTLLFSCELWQLHIIFYKRKKTTSKLVTVILCTKP